jgi:bifunctional ADP-heptose synthase (sugar kinase/adenylyltransferase)
MKFPDWLRVYGDQSWRGDCPTESAEQVTFINRLRTQWPDTIGRVVVHIQNEGKRHAWQAQRDKAAGMTAGAADIVVPGHVTLLIELKRRDHTQSRFQPGQVEYMQAAHELGAFVCVALGADAAMAAVADWQEAQKESPSA